MPQTAQRTRTGASRIGGTARQAQLYGGTLSHIKAAFDPVKDAANIAKLGVSLAQAANIEWDTALTWLDTRENYGEDRECGIGYIGLALYFVVFVERGRTRRIISLRKATRQEVKRYAEA